MIFFDELGRLGLGDGFAQFINRNHFAFLMEMTLGLLVGVQLKFRLPNIYRPVIWLMTGIMLVAVIMSQSRGGIFSVLGIGIFAIFLIVNSRSPAIATSDSKEVRSISTSGFLRSNKILLTLTCIVVFLSISVFMIAFVGGDPVVTRIERLQNEIQERPENRFRRLDIWKATLELIKTRPVAGSGFGAYPVAITPFDQSSGRMTLQQAHDEYLDLVANGGFVAFGMMMLFLVLVFRRASVQLNSKDPFRSAVCFGAILGIVGVLLHNTVDYGLRTTVNAFVFIVLIVACTARVTAPGRHGAVG